MPSIIILPLFWHYNNVIKLLWKGLKLKEKIPKFTLRIDKVLLKKFKYIAASNARSANKELVVLIKKYIYQFEKKYGKIE